MPRKKETIDQWATRILLHAHATSACLDHGYMRPRFGHQGLDYAHALPKHDPYPGRSAPVSAVNSTDRCNTFGKPLSRRLIKQGFPWSLVELPCNGAELGLAVQGQIRTTRQILAQQSVGVLV